MNKEEAIRLLKVLINPESSEAYKQFAYNRLYELLMLLLPEG